MIFKEDTKAKKSPTTKPKTNKQTKHQRKSIERKYFSTMVTFLM